MFTRAIVRPPAANFSDGLTTAALGKPQFELAMDQHSAYCDALQRCGLTLTKLEPDQEFPDSTFVEDAAIIFERTNQDVETRAVITRPGAISRRSEATKMRGVVADLCSELFTIQAPGTLDGGDICQAGNHFFIGISDRTNEAGAKQLAGLLKSHNYSSSLVDIRSSEGLLHLKSGLAYLGDQHLVVTKVVADLLNQTAAGSLRDYELVRVVAGEEYAANCVRINDHVLVAAGYESLAATLAKLGYQTLKLDMSEFQKMDGGLSCLSLRI